MPVDIENEAKGSVQVTVHKANWANFLLGLWIILSVPIFAYYNIDFYKDRKAQ